MLNQLHFSQGYLLNETEHKVLSCILTAIDRGETKINVRDIAGQAYVSTTTVVKLAKKLGYQGYSDMIYSLKLNATRELVTAEGIDLTSILTEVNTDVIEIFAQALLEHRNKCIFIIGLGFSTVISSYFMRRLATLGFLVYDGSPTDMVRGEAKECLSIFLSKSGETRDLVSIAQHTRNLGHQMLLITANEDSALSSLCDAHLTVQSGASIAYSVPDFFVGRTIILLEYILSRLVIQLT